jgi:hypothetical protein
MPWGYMDMLGQKSFIDTQQIFTKPDLIVALKSSLSTGAPPDIKPNDPHSWGAYVDRHANDLTQWIG